MAIRWSLAILLLIGLAAVAQAQVRTGSQQYGRTGVGGTASSGYAVSTYPSSNPFRNPIMQPIPRATSTVNPQQNYYYNAPVRSGW